MRPKFLPLLSKQNQEEIIRDVEGLIKVLSSKNVALDGRHTPALYSRFLSSLLVKHNLNPHFSLDTATSGPTTCLQFTGGPQIQVDSYPCTWPDVVTINNPIGYDNGGTGEMEELSDEVVTMDFSFAHFVRTVTEGFPGLTQEGGLNEWA